MATKIRERNVDGSGYSRHAYTGMAAASFTYTGEAPELSHAVSVSSLGVARNNNMTFMVLGLNAAE